METEAEVVQIPPPSPRPISRRTRSQAAPEWTAQEMLTLSNEVAAVEEDCRRALSSFQRWDIIAANCSAILGGAPRSANQCRHRWNAMLADYRRIQAWEDVEKASYWSLHGERRRAEGLPADFDREVFGTIAGLVRRQERGGEAVAVESESEAPSGRPGGDDNKVVVVKEVSGSRKARQTKSSKTAQRMQDMARKLEENAQHIHAILRGELSEANAREQPPAVDSERPGPADMEFRRRQADELIRALGSLISGVGRFTDLAEADEQGTA